MSVPLDKIYFPVGIQVSPGKSWMYVANSDFDLQFNAGTLQVYDLAKLRSKVPTYCDRDDDCTKAGKVGQTCDLTADPDKRLGPSHRCVGADDDPCANAGTKVQSVADQSLTPGLCKPLEPAPLLFHGTKGGVVSIGAFSTDLLYATNPLAGGKGSRLFVPVRGDATVHWISVDDDTAYPDQGDHSTGVSLDCGQSGPTQKCDDNHRRGTGNDPATITDTQVTLPAEPYGIALQARPYGGVPDSKGSEFVDNVPALHPPDYVPGPLSSFSETLVTTHQTTGQIALFVNTWSTTPNDDDGPQLVSIGGVGLPTGALAVTSVPLPAFWLENPTRVTYLPSFLMTFTNAAQVQLVRTFDDLLSSPRRPFIDTSRSVAIATNASGFESRGIVVENSDRQHCEAPVDGTCAGDPDRAACLLKNCIPAPYSVYAANRSPASLIIGQTPPNVPNTLTDDLPQFTEQVPMTTGPSRVFTGNVIDKNGKLSPRVFIICFDSRRIFVYDPANRRFDAEVITGRGPHAFALDVEQGVDGAGNPVEHAYAYIGHFSDSYIGVIDLDQRHTAAYGTIVLSVGQRTPPRASK
ncbi:MAG TPA: hypothetical protein VH062_07160 [Polyangiaceae bacterium]|nr:hypothetical protein [Polyangiaceae bacterium]